MILFLRRRLFQAVFVLLGVTLITFSLFNLVGGDPVLLHAGKNASPETLSLLRHELGLDRSLVSQYLFFVRQSLTWDWGTSWATKQTVNQMIRNGLGPSLCLTLPAYIISIFMALWLALTAAFYQKKLIDKLLLNLCSIFMSISFLIFIVYGQKIFAFDLNLFPVYGWDPSWSERWRYLSLPILIYIFANLAPKILLFRSALLNEVSKNYVRTAYAKGLSPWKIYSYHILKNAALPIVALVTSQMPTLITGSLLLETYFGIPGIGSLLLKAIHNSDLPMIKALTVMGSLLYICFNIINDLLIGFFDPRTGDSL